MRVRRHLTVFTALFVALILAAAGDADARQRRKKRGQKKKAAAEKVAPKADTKAVSELMGPFKWGMSPKEVMNVLFADIDAKYQERIKATTDIYTQDRLRKDAAKEKARMKKTFVEFDGKKTGWDVSIIDKEIGHKNDESMFVYWENDPESGKDQRRFFFFVDGQLWKMFIAFNSDLFQGKSFQDFKAIMERRYGAGKAELVGDTPVVFWRGDNASLRAIDLTGFYGNFCLAISNPKVEAWIADRRQERNPKVERRDNIVEAITVDEKDGDNDLPDPNVNVIDEITKGQR